MPRALTRLAAVIVVTAVPASPAGSPPVEPSAALRQINEIRRVDLVDVEDGFSFDKPGLVLTFGLEVPEGRRVVDVREQPGPTSADSTGRDLSAAHEHDGCARLAENDGRALRAVDLVLSGGIA